MNRLIIIGNGFDLAHGLPTSYKHFIDDYWQRIPENFYRHLYEQQYIDELIEVLYEFNRGYHDVYYNISSELSKIKNYEDFNNFIEKHSKKSNPIIYENMNGCRLHFNNNFFKVINKKNSQNWVDIENEYYYQLKKIVKSKCLDVSKSEEYWEEEQKKQVLKLNKEFDEVKKLLEKYLNEKVINNYNLSTNSNIRLANFYDYLKPISIFSNEENILKQFINSEDVKEIKEHFEKEKKEELVNNLYFLNFNYTPFAATYSDLLDKDDRIETNINFIHGEINNEKENKINFGFGDEMDDDYKMIENINDNEYLRNFKSFQYLQNSNYSNLLNYIDSGKYQVVIVGHSCGLSDRTLLNTIFEHNNCRSIKVFYHQWKDEDSDEMKDNYTEIIQNISRHFNKKKLMREKIVNKTLCQPLPQIQLPKKV